MHKGWIGVDLDGTLAYWKPGSSIWIIGDPIKEMADRVRQWLHEGEYEVRIVTARVAECGARNEDGIADDSEFARRQRELIEVWCELNFGQTLRVTAQKDFQMVALWDDRAYRVETNTGKLLSR